MRDGRPGAYRVPFRAMAEEPRGALAASEAGLTFDLVRTERPSSAEESAQLQGIRLDQLLRTIVVRRGADDYVFVLVPGGRQIDWPKLRAQLGTRRLSLPDRDEARDATGYERGTITPFGATTAWPVVADAGVRAAKRVAIGAGAHGVNLHVASGDLLRVLHADEADVTSAADG
jgi:Cys-tRNA(Pro)/Cys-tRNA(Cys) deacylase